MASLLFLFISCYPENSFKNDIKEKTLFMCSLKSEYKCMNKITQFSPSLLSSLSALCKEAVIMWKEKKEHRHCVELWRKVKHNRIKIETDEISWS